MKQIIGQELSSMTTAVATSGHNWFESDFCEKNLTRKTGIEISWTINLREHLEMAGKSYLKGFRHCSILSAYNHREESYVLSSMNINA
jgi:hypothetical protein